MGFTAQPAQHLHGVGLVVRLSHYLVTQHDNGIGGEQHLVFSHRVATGLLTSNILRHLFYGQICRIGFINALDNAHFKVDTQFTQQLFSTG